MAKVVPAIQPKTLDEYLQKLRIVRQLTDRFQLDIVDTDFNEAPTVDLSEIESTLGLTCDFHIMARDPIPYLNQARRLQPQLIIIQFEGVADVEAILQRLHDADQKVGLAINPTTAVDDVAHLFSLLDHLLIMAYPAGPSGQKLQPAVLKKVEQLRSLQPKLEIGLDGGVAEDTLIKIAKADFDVVNVTTYLFSAEQPLDRYSELLEALA